MKTTDLAEAFGETLEGDAGAELDPEEGETEAEDEKAVQANADLFFDDTEDKATRLEALRQLVRKLR